MMFSAKSPAESYRAGLVKLEKAERQFRQALDNLHSAIDERRAGDVPGLRRKAGDAEQALLAALDAAVASWREYWRCRIVELEPRLHEAALTIHRYNALCRVVGCGGTTPAQSFIQAALIAPPAVDLLDESGVPTDEPDSALLEDFKGSWR